MSRKKYKPVSFSTTLRNPLRVLSFLDVIKDFNNVVLSEEIILSIEKQLIKQNLYKPLKKPETVANKRSKNIDLSDSEVNKIIDMNPQSHKEAGFAVGWPSRFATHYNMLMEMGLMFFSPNEKIKITKKGDQLLKGDSDLISILSHSIKHIRLGNIFKPGTLNKQQVFLTYIRALKICPNINSRQFFALACAKDSSEKSVKFLLLKSGKEDIEKHWGSKFNANAFERSKETVDDLSRKLFLTGIFKIKKVPEFIFSLNENIDIDSLLRDLSNEINLKNDEYLELMGSEISDFIQTSTSISKNKFLKHWDNELTLEQCVDIFSKCNSKSKINHPLLEYVPRFVLFEMTTALILYKTNPGIKININMHYDDNMTPTAAASGGLADIECEFNGHKTNIEVTLLTGVAQNSNESQSTLRHLIKSKADSLLFIAPNISRDLASTYQFEISRRDLNIGAVNSIEFIKLIKSVDPKMIVSKSKDIMKNQSLVDDKLALRVNNLMKN